MCLIGLFPENEGTLVGDREDADGPGEPPRDHGWNTTAGTTMTVVYTRK